MQLFVKGETIYKVYALLRNGESWIEKLEVVACSTMLNGEVPALIVLKNGREDKISLRDANVIPNKYNTQRIFKTLEAAESYAADSSQWRPLGFSAEEWEDHAKDAYLKETDMNLFLDSWDDTDGFEAWDDK